MNIRVKLACLWLILFLAVLNAICVLGYQQMAETVPVPSTTATVPTTAAELVSGLCTFGDCPVLLPTQMSVASPTTEAVKETLTTVDPEPETSQENYTVEEQDEAIYSDPAPSNNGRTVTCWVTAYCGCYACSEGYGNMTATGRTAQPYHTIAVDPSVIPYGTQVEINGTVYTAEDCGGGINGYEIDVYFAEHWQCEAWPTGYYEVTIY